MFMRLRSNTGAGQPVALIMTRMATALAKIRPRRVLRAASLSQEAGALDEEVAIASTPSSVRLVSSRLIDWVDDIEIVLGLLRGVQIYEPDEVRIETSRSGDHKRQKTEITRKKIV